MRLRLNGTNNRGNLPTLICTSKVLGQPLSSWGYKGELCLILLGSSDQRYRATDSVLRNIFRHPVDLHLYIADNWINSHFDGKTSTPDTIDAFMALWRPSYTTLSDAEWIAVNRGISQNPHPPRIEEMEARFQVLILSSRTNFTLPPASGLSSPSRRVMGGNLKLVYIHPQSRQGIK